MSLLARLLGRSATEAVAWVETGKLSALLNGPTPPLVIDVRGPGEFTGPLGHIENAQNIPLDQIPTRIADLLGEQRPLVLVCHTDRRSAAAADHLRRAGKTEVAVLRGGMVAWRSDPMR
ncbi:rhodanese-like domain-containing protein [Acidisphaera sp. S103]|uniref:rhodanese-like domain-containing protein n=1 Tax=Acidisphaera sp. S103 TaxID=1747223 RepID=UPI00131B1DFC|nr:rhodanese-like domain-containing protein [Acidisphaera sp. S103]